MKRMQQVTLCMATALVLAACAAPTTRSGSDLSADGLQRLGGTGFDEVWVRPGVSLASYRGVMLEAATVDFREVGEDRIYEVGRRHAVHDAFPISADRRERIEQSFQEKLIRQLGKSRRYQRVEATGPAILALRATLADFVSAIPEEVPQRQVYVNSVGEATLVVELRDAVTGELLARASRHDEAYPRGFRLIRADSATSWVEMDNQMHRWGGDVRRLLDQLHRVDGT